MGQDFELRESQSELTSVGNAKKSGCVVSTVMGFVLVLLAILITVVVGLIVFFAVDGNKPECVNDDVSGVNVLAVKIERYVKPARIIYCGA